MESVVKVCDHYGYIINSNKTVVISPLNKYFDKDMDCMIPYWRI